MFSIYGSLPGAVSSLRSASRLAVGGEKFQALLQLGAPGRPGGAPGPQRDPMGSPRNRSGHPCPTVDTVLLVPNAPRDSL